jgi:hypothetical protein
MYCDWRFYCLECLSFGHGIARIKLGGSMLLYKEGVRILEGFVGFRNS